MYIERGDGRPDGVAAALRSLLGRDVSRVLRGDGGEPTGGDAPDDRSVGDDTQRCQELMARQLGLPRSQVRSISRSERTSATETVLTEADRDYDMLVLGDVEHGASATDPLFGDPLDAIIRDAPCPVLVASAFDERDENGSRLEDVSFRRILLPTSGTQYTHHAAEVAFTVARDHDAIVDIVNVVRPSRVEDVFVTPPELQSSLRLGEKLVDREAGVGRRMGASVRTNVFVGERDPEQELVDLVAEKDYDLVVLGSNLRPLSGRAYFGHRVEYVVKHAECPVAILASV